jgi:hypothetical protein
MSYKNLKLVYFGTSVILNLLAIGQIVAKVLQGR